MSEDVPILITGFGPFGHTNPNPTTALAESVASSVSGARSATLPTSYRRSVQVLDQAMAASKPQVVLMLGYSARVPFMRIEERAQAWCRSNTPDVDGVVWSQPDDGLPDRRTGLPADEFARDLRVAGVDSVLSTDAGGYVCNATYYYALGQISVPCIFVHVGPAAGTTQSPAFVKAVTTLARMLQQWTIENTEAQGQVKPKR